jgi:hypothetical protein
LRDQIKENEMVGVSSTQWSEEKYINLQVLVGKLEGKRPLSRPRKDHVKIGIKNKL